MEMADIDNVLRYITGISSTALRLSAFVLLRWFPGSQLPTLIFAFLLTYIPSFVFNLWNSEAYDVIAEEIDIIASDDPIFGSNDKPSADKSRDDDGDDEAPEVDIEETLVIARREPEVLKTLLTGLPSPSSLLWSIVTFGINLTLAAMVADSIWRAPILYQAHDLSFARVGYVSDSSARVLIREPDANKYPVTVSYRYADAPARLVTGQVPDAGWKAAGSLPWLDNGTDFTGTLEISRLVPDVRYQWAASNNHSGFFTTAPRPGHTSTRPGSTGVFTFLHSSCLKNGFPYAPFAHPLSNSGLRYLSDAIKNLHAQFMLFLGDFIYIDVPHLHGSDAEAYRREYRQLYASPDWPAATAELPWIHVYDDHEVENDWDRNTTGVFAAAYDPYKHYHTSVNPPPVRRGESYFSFTQGPATFFMLDTRRYRSPNDATNGTDPITGDPTKTMLGAQQRADLLAWLKRDEPRGVKWKILVSSVPFTKNWWYNAQDTWRGYLGEREIILEAMWDVSLRASGVGVIILSGDRHEFAATAFPPPPEGKEQIVGLGPIGLGANPINLVLSPDSTFALRTRRKRWPLSATVHEFSCSPLSMFYLPVRTYAESSTSDDYVSDVCIKYIPDGNSKFGAVSISNPATSEQSVLNYRLFVDGQEAWSYTLTTPPEVRGGSRTKDAIWG